MTRWRIPVLLATVGIVESLAQSPVDTSKWNTHVTRLGRYRVSLRYPTERLWPDFPPTLESEIDLNNPRTWKGEGPSQGPLNNFVSVRWEYRGWFWQGVLTALHVDIYVMRRPDGASEKFLDGESFERFVRVKVEQGRIRWNQEVKERAENSPSSSIERKTLHKTLLPPAFGFEQARMGDRIAIKFLSPGNALTSKIPTVIYYIPIDEEMYLIMPTSCTPSSLFPEKTQKSLGWAQSTGKAIAESLRITTE